jgi:ADP-ribose pyrophosphatase
MDKPSLNSFGTKDFSVLKKERLYDGFMSVDQYVLIHALFEGGESGEISRELLLRKDAVAVLLHDPELNVLVLVEQFRVGAINDAETPWMLEFVAGLIDTDETPEQIAVRECKEEAACEPQSLRLIHEFYLSPGACSEKLYLYYAEVSAEGLGGVHGLKEENEDIKVHLIPCSQAFSLLKEGKINNAIGIIGLQWLEAYLNK